MEAVPATTKGIQVSAGKNVAALVPQTIDEAFRVATAVSRAGMAPYGMDTPEKCLIAIMSGAEVGLPPMQSVQNIAVINNRPCMWGDALIGVVRASGFAEYIKEWIEGEGDQMVAHCETLRKGEKEPIVETFSVDDAKKAGLWQTEAKVQRRSKGGGTYQADNDSPWYKHPKRMLKMRARAFLLRDVYSDVLKGLQVREEVEDYEIHRGPDRAKDVTPSDAAAKYMKPTEKQAGPGDNRDGFNSAGIDREIEGLTGDSDAGDEGEGGLESSGGPQTNTSSSIYMDALENMMELLPGVTADTVKMAADAYVANLSEGKGGDVQGRLQTVLSWFHDIVDEKTSANQVREKIREMESTQNTNHPG